jgi:hypothetical protein
LDHFAEIADMELNAQNVAKNLARAAMNRFIAIIATSSFVVVVTNSAGSVVPFAKMYLARNVNLHIAAIVAIHFIVADVEHQESFAKCATKWAGKSLSNLKEWMFSFLSNYPLKHLIFPFFSFFQVLNVNRTTTHACFATKISVPTAKAGLSLQAVVIVVGNALIVCRHERIARAKAKRTMKEKEIPAPIASSPKMIWTMSISNNVLDAKRSSIVAVLVKKRTGKNTVVYVTQQQQRPMTTTLKKKWKGEINY